MPSDSLPFTHKLLTSLLNVGIISASLSGTPCSPALAVIFMKRGVLLVILTVLFVSCDRRVVTYENFSNDIVVDESLIKLMTDTLDINWTGGSLDVDWGDGKAHPNEKYSFNYFDDNAGMCRLSGDTLFISTGQGYGPSNSLNISIFERKYSVKLMEHNCTYSHDYTTIQQSLKINRPSFNVGDTLTGELFYQATYIWDSVRNVVDTTTISGKFKLRIRSKIFNWDSLRVENNRKEMFATLSNTKADTVKRLNLSKCGLTSLPNELTNFINLESLDLEGNNFDKADLNTLCQLTKLRSLTLDNCNLNTIPTGIFCLKSLEEINLFNNNLKYLPAELFTLTEMKELQLGNNLLTSLPNDILKMKKLRMLEISGSEDKNKIKKLPPSFFKTLKNIDEFYSPDIMPESEYREFDERTNDKTL